MTDVTNWKENLRSYFALSFTTVEWIRCEFRGYFKLSFIIVEVGNLDANQGVNLCISFYNGRGR